MADLRTPAGPPPEALAYLDAKGMRPAFDWRDVWGEEHGYQFTVAKALELDVLADIRGELRRAIHEGLPFERFAAELTPKLQAAGWWGRRPVVDPETGAAVDAQLGSPRRLRTIYDANTRTAYAAGHWERAQRTKRALPYFIYELGPSEEHRPHHVALAGTILPVDDPFWDTHFPPNGWGCKCRLRQITRFEADRLGGPSARPAVETRPWTNRRTGKTVQVPVGIDPGWATNPGKARARNLARKLEESLAEGGEANARAAIADLWASRTPEALVRARTRLHLPVAVSDELAAAGEAVSSIVVAANDVIEAKLAKHRTLRLARFADIQRFVDEGERLDLRDKGRGLVHVLELDGVLWAAVIRRSLAGYLQVATLFQTSPDRIRAMRAAAAKR